MAGKNDVNIKLTADASGVKQGLGEVDAKVAATQSKAESGAEGGLGFKKSVTHIRQWIGSLTAAAGIATTFYFLGQRLRETWDKFFESGTERAKKFNEALLSSEVTERLKATTSQIEDVQAKLATALEPLGSDNLKAKIGLFVNGDSVESLKEELTALRKLQQSEQGAVSADARRAKEKQQREQNADLAIGDLEVRRKKAEVIDSEADRDAVLARIQHEQRLVEIGRLGNSQLEEDKKKHIRQMDEAEQAASDKIASDKKKAEDAELERIQAANKRLVRESVDAAVARTNATTKALADALRDQNQILRNIARQQNDSIGGFNLGDAGTQAQLDFYSLVVPSILRSGGGR